MMQRLRSRAFWGGFFDGMALPVVWLLRMRQAHNNGMRPMSTAPKDGRQILALYDTEWGFPRKLKIINHGQPHHIAYSDCWVCSVCTVSVDEKKLLGWWPLPEFDQGEAGE